jgi:Pyridoxamine 5'-phosphate oxidase
VAASPRSTAERKRDVLAVLERNGDAFLATAGRDGKPHLIAVATWWTGAEIVMATISGTRTARNLTVAAAVRLAFGTSNDVVMVDARVAGSEPAGDGASELAHGFAAACGWNPGEESGDWSFFRLQPLKIQAYRGYEETAGRDVMLRGEWL